MLLGGSYATVKDYLQPILEQTAVALPLLITLGDDHRRSAILVGVIYFALYLLSALASRMADPVSRGQGGEDIASFWVIAGKAVCCLLMIPALVYGFNWLAVVSFVGLAMCQNLWRPMFLSRLDRVTEGEMGAVTLSVDSQAKAVFTMIAAPIVGLAVDELDFWIIGVVGLVAAMALLVNPRRYRPISQSTAA
jgi:hypothetical protein